MASRHLDAIFLNSQAPSPEAGYYPAFGVDHSPTHEAQLPVCPDATPTDYTLRIGAAPIERAPKQIVSTITYNGHFPGPLLRFKEGQAVTVEVHNDTDTPEQLHWHGQMVSTDVDGAAEEGTPFIPAHGMRRIVFTPRQSGFRFYQSCRTRRQCGPDSCRGPGALARNG